jgi:hypothetical protein
VAELPDIMLPAHSATTTDIRNNNNNNVKYKNYQLRTNVNINLTEKTELVVRLSGTFNDYSGPLTGGGGIQTELYNLATHTSPVDFPAFYPPDAANQRTQHILFGNIPSENSTIQNPGCLLNWSSTKSLTLLQKT